MGRSTGDEALRARASEHAAERVISEAIKNGRRSPRVAVIGNGFAGLCIAIKLKAAGIDTFTIYDKADGVGGTWRDNSYPGAACDIPSHLYSFSFASKKNWNRRFAYQPEILQYLEDTAEEYGLLPHMRFGVEVTSATFDDEDSTWTLTFDGDDEAVGTFDIVVSGLGQLNRPFVPDIDGLDTFEGPVMHSARWDHDHDFSGESVAVIGNGASALQFIPEVAKQTAHLTIFQRSANWVLPKNDGEYSERARFVLAHVPGAQRLYRAYIYWRLEVNFAILRRNSRVGTWIASKFSDVVAKMVTEDLPREALIPDYPPGCKRILISNNYYQTLARPDVDVELDPIDRIEPDAVVTTTGKRIEVDALLLGTGFKSTEFLAPMEVVGAGGRDLNDEWSGGAESYLGVALSGFPNFFMLYGPNTNLGHNSIIFMIEAQSRYIVRQLAQTFAEDVPYLDVAQGAQDAYNTSVQRQARKTVWASDCSSWYKTDDGKITNNWTSWTVAYWKRMRTFKRGDYVSPAR